MSKLKGSHPRSLNIPGDKVFRQQKDLKHFRKYIENRNKRILLSILPLTSLIDVFSILCIFLLMNYFSSGEVFFINKNLKLPIASKASSLNILPLISIQRNSISFDSIEFGKRDLYLSSNGQELIELRKLLQAQENLFQKLNPDKEMSHSINIQADENLALYYVKRVMNTLIAEGWTNINFVTRPN